MSRYIFTVYLNSLWYKVKTMLPKYACNNVKIKNSVPTKDEAILRVTTLIPPFGGSRLTYNAVIRSRTVKDMQLTDSVALKQFTPLYRSL